MAPNDTMLHVGEIWDLDSSSTLSRPKLRHWAHGALAVSQGRILQVGHFDEVLKNFPKATPQISHTGVMVPGFIDTHLHFPQLDIIGAYGEELMDWLRVYTYPHESLFADPGYARSKATPFLRALLANGTTTASVYCATFAHTADVLFEAAEKMGICLIAGKMSMDCHAPSELLQSAEEDERDNRELISKWHEKENRLFVALTPRFAAVCSEELLGSLGKLKQEFPSLYVQTHHSESLAEIDLVKSLFPGEKNYLDVYRKHGLVGTKTVLGHSIHPDSEELDQIQALKAGISHCPSSNAFLGSGLFPLNEFQKRQIPLSLGSDIGAGTSLSLWQTMGDTYKIQKLRGHTVSPSQIFFLPTLGGARVLGLEKEIGNFDPGKRADFQVIATHSTSTILDSVEARLFRQMFPDSTPPVERVYVAGTPQPIH